MPRQIRKRVARKRRRRKRRSIPYSVTDPKRIVRMRYSSSAYIDPAAGLAGTHMLSANGLYDPDITGVGHQPYGFDEMMASYDHYTVIGAKIKATFLPNATTSYYGGILIKDSSSYSGSVERIIESGQSPYKFVAKTSTSPITMNAKISVPKFFSTDSPLSDNRLKGSVIANPTEQVYFALWAGPVEGTQDVPSILVHYTIDFIAVLHEPKMLQQS